MAQPPYASARSNIGGGKLAASIEGKDPAHLHFFGNTQRAIKTRGNLNESSRLIDNPALAPISSSRRKRPVQYISNKNVNWAEKPSESANLSQLNSSMNAQTIGGVSSGNQRRYATIEDPNNTYLDFQIAQISPTDKEKIFLQAGGTTVVQGGGSLKATAKKMMPMNPSKMESSRKFASVGKNPVLKTIEENPNYNGQSLNSTINKRNMLLHQSHEFGDTRGQAKDKRMNTLMSDDQPTRNAPRHQEIKSHESMLSQEAIPRSNFQISEKMEDNLKNFGVGKERRNISKHHEEVPSPFPMHLSPLTPLSPLSPSKDLPSDMPLFTQFEQQLSQEIIHIPNNKLEGNYAKDLIIKLQKQYSKEKQEQELAKLPIPMNSLSFSVQKRKSTQIIQQMSNQIQQRLTDYKSITNTQSNETSASPQKATQLDEFLTHLVQRQGDVKTSPQPSSFNTHREKSSNLRMFSSKEATGTLQLPDPVLLNDSVCSKDSGIPRSGRVEVLTKVNEKTPKEIPRKRSIKPQAQTAREGRDTREPRETTKDSKESRVHDHTPDHEVPASEQASKLMLNPSFEPSNPAGTQSSFRKKDLKNPSQRNSNKVVTKPSVLQKKSTVLVNSPGPILPQSMIFQQQQQAQQQAQQQQKADSKQPSYGYGGAYPVQPALKNKKFSLNIPKAQFNFQGGFNIIPSSKQMQINNTMNNGTNIQSLQGSSHIQTLQQKQNSTNPAISQAQKSGKVIFPSPGSAAGKKNGNNNVRVHIMDQLDNKKVLEVVHCDKEIITNSMVYFREHLKNLNIGNFESIDIHVQCDPSIFKILYQWCQIEATKDSENQLQMHIKQIELDKIISKFSLGNILQILISADYLIMKTLKFHCLKYFRKELKNLIRMGYTSQDPPKEEKAQGRSPISAFSVKSPTSPKSPLSPKSPGKKAKNGDGKEEKVEIPFEQIEDSLFEDIAQTLKNDPNSIVRLIQAEREFLVKFIRDEDKFYEELEARQENPERRATPLTDKTKSPKAPKSTAGKEKEGQDSSLERANSVASSEDGDDYDQPILTKSIVIEFIQKMLFRLLELSVEEMTIQKITRKVMDRQPGYTLSTIARSRELHTSHESTNVQYQTELITNPLQVCKYCDDIYPQQIFQMSNAGLPDYRPPVPPTSLANQQQQAQQQLKKAGPPPRPEIQRNVGLQARKYFSCQFAPNDLFQEKKNALKCHLADQDISFDFSIFLEQIKESVFGEDNFVLVGKLYLDIVSKHIYAVCQNCSHCFTYCQMESCLFHPKAQPVNTYGSFIGLYPCCGQFAVVKSKEKKNFIEHAENKGCKLKKHQQIDLNNSSEAPLIKAIYKKIGFLESQGKFLRVCDYFKAWVLGKESTPPEVKELELDYKQLFLDYILHLRQEKNDKQEKKSPQKQLQPSYRNPQEEEFERAPAGRTARVAKGKSKSPVYTFKSRWGLTTGIPKRETLPVKKEASSSESEYDSEEEPWTPFQDHPYPQQRLDGQLNQDGDDIEFLVKSLVAQRRVEKPEKMEKIVQSVVNQKRTQQKQAKAMNALTNGHSSLVSRHQPVTQHPGFGDSSFPAPQVREE